MNDTSWIDPSVAIFLFALAIGLAAALIGWLLTRSVTEVPAEDRQYKDPPPLGFRLVWLPIQWVAHYLGFIVSAAARERILVKLRKAGLDYAVSPVQFVAARIVCGVVAALVCWWVVGSFDNPTGAADNPGLSEGVYAQVMVAGLLFGWLYPAIWLRDRLDARRRELLKTLPFYLDIVTLCVEAGLNFQGAMAQAVAKGPKGVLRDEFQRVLRDIRAGKGRADALRAMADRLNEPSVTNFTASVIQAESMGMNLGPVLRAQADQRRTERFLRAEKLAMEAPVKMLFPLIAFIFPCTFIVLFFPIVMKFMESGI